MFVTREPSAGTLLRFSVSLRPTAACTSTTAEHLRLRELEPPADARDPETPLERLR
jgi:hypothetical protein